jgi:hypothetical protein
MRLLRVGDDDGLHRRIGHQHPPVCRRPRKAKGRAIGFGRVRLRAQIISSRGRSAVSKTAPTAVMATACALPM